MAFALLTSNARSRCLIGGDWKVMLGQNLLNNAIRWMAKTIVPYFKRDTVAKEALKRFESCLAKGKGYSPSLVLSCVSV